MSETPLKLGKYEILRELGRGAMGVVYEAFDPSIERTVALKTIRRDQLEGVEADDVMSRFQREAKAAGRLNHPNIVSIYDFGEDNGTAFMGGGHHHGGGSNEDPAHEANESAEQEAAEDAAQAAATATPGA